MSVKTKLGNSTFTILDHLGFEIMWDGVRMFSFEQCVTLDLPDHVILDVVLKSGDTSVSREIRFADLWEEVPATLVAALAAWDFLVDPFGK